MSFKVAIIRHKEYVEAIVSGEYDMQEAVDKFTLVLGACQITGLSKVVIDFRKLHGDIYAVQKIMYTQQVIDKIKNYFASGGKDLQIAYVGKAPQVSTYEPGLEMAEREEIQAIVTDDINEAVEWLGVKCTNKAKECLLSIDDVCEYLGVGRDTVYKWIETEGLPAYRLGRLWKFNQEEVYNWVKNRARQEDGGK